eukprot:13332193-Ditylum_brightwellii.AAC.1
MVVYSAAEAECSSLFSNSQTTITICHILEEIGHLHQSTKVKTNNKTANSVVYTSMCVKQSTSWDMWYHCLCEATMKKTLWIF